MRRTTSTGPRPEPRASVRLVRCAVYTRKSSEEGMEQEFNSLDAQREAGEAFVKSQQHEAVRVRAIFDLYLQHEALLPVVKELEARGWTNKRWVTRAGHDRGGDGFTKTSLHRLLTNVAYAGKVRYKDEVHDGEHPAIVDPAVWQRVQALFRRNGVTGG